MRNKLLRKGRTITSSILLLSMVIFNFGFIPVARATSVSPALTIGSQTASHGNVITVPVTARFVDVQGIQLSVNFDGSMLSYVGCSSTNVVCSSDVALSDDGNEILLTWYDVVNMLTLNDEPLLTLQFRVESEAATETVLSFTPVEIIGSTGNITGSFTFNPGTITLNPAPTLSSISIANPANKLTYTVGDTLDISGLAITGTYSDGSSQEEPITESNITGFDSSAPMTGQVLTITVNGQTVTYTIDIVAAVDKSSLGEAIGTAQGKLSEAIEGTEPGQYTLGSKDALQAAIDDAEAVQNNNSATQAEVNSATETLNAAIATFDAAIIDAPDFVSLFNSIHETLVGNGVENNIDTCGENPSECVDLYFEKVIDDVPLGKLSFTNALDLTSDETTTFLQNLGAKLDQGAGRIALNTSESAVFAATGATLEMYNMPEVSQTNLVVRDDNGNVLSQEGIISGFSYDSESGTVSFNTEHFTQFDIDTESPIITLNGESSVTIEAGMAYEEFGANVTDNIDTNLIANIDSSNVDTNFVGTYVVVYSVQDSAGNQAESVTRTVNVVDTTAPIITINPYDTNPTNADITVTASTNEGTLNIDSYTFTENGSFDFTATDDYGNTATETVTISNIDKVAPTATVSYDITALTNHDVVATITPSETVTGDLSHTFTENGSFTFNFTDDAGNIGSAEASVDYIDKVAPIISVRPYTTTPTNQDVVVTVTTGEGTLNTNSHTFTENGSFDFVATDAAGNVTTKTVTITNIDRTAPTIELLGDEVVSIYTGTSYVDDGVSVSDNADGDIASKLATVNPVNVETAGTYTITYNVTDSAGNIAAQIVRTVKVLAVSDSQTVIGESTTVNSATPSIVIGDNAPETSTITVGSTITDAQLDVAALLSGTDTKSATISTDITVNSDTSVGAVSVEIPSGAVISGSSSWTGAITLPQVKDNSSVSATPDSGYTAEVSSVIEIGYGDVKLTFDKAVRIKIAGQAGNYIGYSRDGVFTAITNVCSDDTQKVGDALTAGGDCKVDVGDDLVVWTKHFTKFVTYTQSVIPSSGGGGSIIQTSFVSPVGGVSVKINNDDAVAKSVNVVLTLNGGSDAVRMAVSNTTDFSAVSQESYAVTKNWTLPSGNGIKTVYVKFYNVYGSISAVVSDSIQLNGETVVGITAPANVSTPAQEVLGAKVYNYADGTLLRGTDKKIYVVINGKLQHIVSLKQLAKYAGKPILNVGDDVIESYNQAVLGAKTSASIDGLVASLKFGQRNAQVKQLQDELKTLGFFPTATTSTGFYGAITKAAVQKYLNQ